MKKDDNVLVIKLSKDDNQGDDDGFEENVLEDSKYKRRAALLIQNVLSEGESILQMSDGSILTTETRVKVVKYKWESQKGRFKRVSTSFTSIDRMPEENPEPRTEKKVAEKAKGERSRYRETV